MHNQRRGLRQHYFCPQEQPYRAGTLHIKKKKFSLAVYLKFTKGGETGREGGTE